MFIYTYIVFRIYYKIQVGPRKMTGFFYCFFFKYRTSYSQSKQTFNYWPTAYK